jgi:hypothetical protein
VGYGDILPQNNWELTLAGVNIIVGVIVFSSLQGNLASQAQEITKTAKSSGEKQEQIDDLESKYNIAPELIEKLRTYFQNNDIAIETQSKFDIAHILRILPANLKINLVKFMYADTIK